MSERALFAHQPPPRTDGRPDSRPDVREVMPQVGDLTHDFDFSQQPRPPMLLPEHPAFS